MADIATDYERVRAELAETQRLLQDAKGRALAATRDRDDTKREAEKTMKAAEALKLEADNTIATAAEQLAQANAISMGIYALGQWATSIMESKALAIRLIYREEKTWCELLDNLCSAVDKGSQKEMKDLVSEARKRLGIVRGNTEALRVELVEDFNTRLKTDTTEIVNKLLTREI